MIAATLLAMAAAVPGIPLAAAQAPATDATSATARENLAEFGACLSTEKKADILFVLDESASLRGPEATDPDNLRVDATKDLIEQLGVQARDLDADINVKLAAFGEGYRSDPDTYGGWENTRTGADRLDAAVDSAAQRNNDPYTIYGDAFTGALTEFSARDSGSCRAMLFFTDGQLTVPGEAADDQAARNAVCSPESPVGVFRRTGIQLFSVGLIPGAAETPEQLLRAISEEDSCVPGTRANGAFFNAGTNPAALFAAFRSILPAPGGIDADRPVDQGFDFILDNSVSPVRLSAQPRDILEPGQLVPTLSAPDGTVLDLTRGRHTMGSTAVDVVESSTVPGMVDVEMTLADGGDWAGRWTFGYRVTGPVDANYHATMVISPGLKLNADALSESSQTGLSISTPLNVSLVDATGTTRQLAGTAPLTATFTPDGGAPVTLVDNTGIEAGSAEVPLDAVGRPAAGVVTLSTVITTDGGGIPGTTLSPIEARFPVAITPATMPRVPGGISADLESRETTVSIPVEGPGRVWVEEGDLATDGAVLPAGVGSVALTSPHSSRDSALTLGDGEHGELEITLTSDQLADGPVRLLPTLHLEDASNPSESAPINVPISGNMRAPVNTGAFSLALIAALLLALLLPLALMYLIKFITGKIPRRPGIHALGIPVRLDNSRLLRTDRGGEFDLTFEELVAQTPRTTSDGKSVVLAGHEVTVKLGLNPFTPAYAASTEDYSMSDSGDQTGNRARLPLAVHNHWFLISQVSDPDQATVVIAVDESISRDGVGMIVQQIRANAPDRLRSLREQVEQARPPAAEPEQPLTTAAPKDPGWGSPESRRNDTASGHDSPGWHNGPEDPFRRGNQQ